MKTLAVQNVLDTDVHAAAVAIADVVGGGGGGGGGVVAIAVVDDMVMEHGIIFEQRYVR